MNNIDKVSKKAGIIRSVIGLIVCLSSIFYGVCKYIEETKQCKIDVEYLRKDLAEMKQASITKHQLIEDRINQSEKNFQMTTTKLDVALVRISTDLQFIKEQLISKGMSK